MQTLISAFDDSTKARKAIERLVYAGFARADVHLQEAPGQEHVGADRGFMESIGHFFVSLFGQDDVERHADRYSGAVRRGRSVVVVDVHSDDQAANALVILHDSGAVNVDDGNEPSANVHSGAVHRVEREGQMTVRDIVGARQAKIENDIDQRQSELAKAAGRATVNTERAAAANDPVSGDRPGYRE